jgi:DNA-binding response OmpR family regulator
MKPTKILVVEDEFILYDEMSEFLIENGFLVLDYTKSYDEALKNIQENNPDIVLLDINLIGEKDGIEIGEKLFYEFHIPFIYITDFADEVTLKRALRTHPNIFQVKSKPLIDKTQLLISIRTVLNTASKEETSSKKGIFVLKDYLSEIKNQQHSGGDFLSKELLQFHDISFISTEKYFKSETDTEATKVKINYVRIETIDKYSYFFKSSLINMLKLLPSNFIRISENNIINISPNNLDGRINGSHISVNGKTFKISNSFKKNVSKHLAKLYEM